MTTMAEPSVSPEVVIATIGVQGIKYEIALPHADEDYIQKTLLNTGEPYEHGMLQDMAQKLAPGDLVLDVGAHIGNHTLFLAAVAGARVVAFEPNGELSAALEKSARRNGFENKISVRSIGLGNTAAMAHFERHIPENLGQQALALGEGEIEVLPLDNLKIDGPVRMLKIDVEGMELEVLEGAANFIKRDRPLIYVESHDEDTFRMLSNWALAHDYSYWDTFNITPTHLFRPVETVDLNQRIEHHVAREVVQEYRLQLQLRRARKAQADANSEVAELHEEIDRLKHQLGEENIKAEKLASREQELLTAQTRIEALTNELSRREQEIDHFNRRLDEANASEKRLASLNEASTAKEAELEAEIAGREQELSAVHARIKTLTKELSRKNEEVKVSRKGEEQAMRSLAIFQNSTSYQLGRRLISATTSLRGAAGLPLTLIHLFVRGLRRRRAAYKRTTAKNPLVAAATDPIESTQGDEIEQWLTANPHAREARSILYADINLNVVDGSSVWLSSMASILCSAGRCLLISKSQIHRDVITSNIQHAENLVILDPSAIRYSEHIFNISEAIEKIRALDEYLPNLRLVVIRGLDAATKLFETRQFRERAACYLTDFFTISESGRKITDEQRRKLNICTTQAKFLLVQTPQIAQEIKIATGQDFRSLEVPPVIPNTLPRKESEQVSRRVGEKIKVGYAGKINSRWGIIELLDWAEKLRADGVNLELHIVADKISNGPDPEHFDLREVIFQRMNELGARHYMGLNRSSAIDIMSNMDFVWCWRPSLLEDSTLELSTKLIEMVAAGARCICYPNSINREALGNSYPFFVKNIDDLRALITSPCWPDPPIDHSERLRKNHGLKEISNHLLPELMSPSEQSSSPKILFAGDDFKFIETYISSLKSRGYHVLIDRWGWGKPLDIERSERQLARSDIVFCEWGLANAVWYSKNIPRHKKLFIRIHAQEVRSKGRRFGKEININPVEKVIFVSNKIRQKAMDMWGWPVEKTKLIPNFVLDLEYLLPDREMKSDIHLGILGIVPKIKRFDRAVDLLARLTKNGHDAYLHIKGHRPETLPFMRAPGRVKELDYYYAQYARINNDPHLKRRVFFEPWGNDVAQWYRKIDVILSSSDTESFHYALADGVLSGCFPVIWPWEGAENIYTPDWIIRNTDDAVERILDYKALSSQSQLEIARKNRDLVKARYGERKIFQVLDKVFFSNYELAYKTYQTPLLSAENAG